MWIGCGYVFSCYIVSDALQSHGLLPSRLFMGVSRQEYWSGLPFPSSGDFPNPGIEPWSPPLQADSLLTELWGKPLHNKQITQQIIFFLTYFLPRHVVCGILVPGPGIEPRPLAVKAPSPNQWTTRESIWINMKISELGAKTLQLLILRPYLQCDWGLL